MVGLKLLLIFSIALVCSSIKDSATAKFTSEEKEFIEKNWEYIKEDLNTKDKEIVIDDGEIKMTACIPGKAVTDPGCIDILLEGLKNGDLTVDDISEEKYLKTFIETLKSDNPEVVEAALIPIYEIVSDGTDYHIQILIDMGLLKELKRAGEMSQDTTEIVILLIRKLASNSPSQIQAIYEAGLIDFLVNNIDFITIFGEKELPASFILLRILNKANNKGEILLSILHYESLMTLIDKLNSTEDRSLIDDIVMIIQICLDHAEKENTILHQKAMEILTMHVNVEKLNEDTDSGQKDEL